MRRPALDLQFSAETILLYYWLKTNWQPFVEIVVCLPQGQMPSTFTRATVLAPGWHGSQALRPSLSKIAPQFEYNQHVRDYVERSVTHTANAAQENDPKN